MTFLHALEQAHGALAMQEEVFVHDEERVHFELFFHVAHDFEEFVAGLEEVDELSLAAEERRSGAEVAAHGAADRGDDGGRGRALAFRQADAHDAGAHSGNDGGMADGSALVFAEVAAHPGNAFAADNVVGIDHLFDAGDGGDVTADDDRGVGREFADHAAHLTHLADVDDDAGDANDVVMIGFQFAREVVARGEVENGARRGDVRLDQHDAPGAMKHAQREAALGARDLIVIKLHRIDGAAAEFVVLRVRAEDGAQQNAGVWSL